MSCRLGRSELVGEVARLRAELRDSRREVRQLGIGNVILRDAAGPLIHPAPAREGFVFVHARRVRFGIRRLCRVPVAGHGDYHAWVRAGEVRERRGYGGRDVARWVLEMHTARAAYGAVCIARGLRRLGVEGGRRRVAGLVRERGMAGFTRRGRRSPTKPGRGAAAVSDLIRRGFTAPVPGLTLTGGIGCLRTDGGWLYLCGEELIGYAIAPRMRASLAVEAITSAHRTGPVAGNAIMRTDRGGRYPATTYRNAPARSEIRQSTSRSGSCSGGAAAESFFATVKAEIGIGTWPDRATARRDIENWITDYNERRVHCALDYRPPTAARIARQQRTSTRAEAKAV